MGNSNDGTICMEKVNAEIQIMYDDHIYSELKKLTIEEREIAQRMIDIQHLLKELEKYKDEKGIFSLDALGDSILKFQEKHFPAICKENKSVVTEDQNPFPAEFEIDNVNANALADCIDKLHILAEQEQNTLTHISRGLKQKTEWHYQVSLMTAHGSTNREGMKNSAVRNQKTAG